MYHHVDVIIKITFWPWEFNNGHACLPNTPLILAIIAINA